MMVLSALRPDASLPEFLAHRARSASIYRLSIDLVAGVGAIAAAVRFRPGAWLLVTSVALCFAAYGAWGLADRAGTVATTRVYPRLGGSMEAVCALLGAVGVIATAGVLLSVWALALGTWIS
jgi:hypothetical protein